MNNKQPFEIAFTSALPLGDLVASVTLASGQQELIVIRAGRYQGSFPERVVQLQLTAQAAPAGELPLHIPDATSEAGAPLAGSVFSIEELFESGVAVSLPRVELQLIWGLHCHRPVSVHPAAAPDGSGNGSPERAVRFGSFEHITCAELVGMDATGKMLTFADRRAAFHYKTKLPVGKMQLTFGEIIALAGDYYAYLDGQAARELNKAWPNPPRAVGLMAGDYRKPALRDESPEVVRDILHTTYRDKNASQDKVAEVKTLAHDGLFGHYPVRRYLALASQNYCHFACQPPTGFVDDTTNEALKSYRAYHQRALALAAEAWAQRSDDLLKDALVIDAFGCHFLTDLFATGHMRVPRRVLSKQYGIIRGALGLAHEMHCEDNKLGLWCTTRIPQNPRVVWRGFGDTMLSADAARCHFDRVKQAVARSAAEVFAHSCGVSIAPADSAEALVPLPLAAGTGPQPGDVYPEGNVDTGQPTGEVNHYPKYCLVPALLLVARRAGPPQENLYVDQDDRVAGPFQLSFAGQFPAVID